jgi:mannose-6-phosphate isomerase-like protein (cupin superfamily)
MTDFGPTPFVIDIVKATLANDNYRTVLWTGGNMQLTTMMIKPGEDIGLEVHPHTDQFLRIEQGQGVCQMGPTKDNLTLAQPVFDDYGVFVPAGTWHNITNTGSTPLKLYTLYAPPNHAFGAVPPTKAVAEAEEDH